MAEEDTHDAGTPMSWRKEPELYLCDDWMLPVPITRKPKPVTNPEDKLKARVAKNVMPGALLSMNAGYRSLIQQYQEINRMPLKAPYLNSVSLTSEQVFSASASAVQGEVAERRSYDLGGKRKGNDLRLYHVVSVKQSLREDLAEHSYQFGRRASDWSCPTFQVPLQFEPVELYVIDALGQTTRCPRLFQTTDKGYHQRC